VFGAVTAAEVVALKSVFDLLDVDGSGSVDIREFVSSRAWKDSGFPQLAPSVFESIDRDKDGFISLRELCLVVFPNTSATEVERMVEFAATKAARVRSAQVNAALSGGGGGGGATPFGAAVGGLGSPTASAGMGARR
jgi:hypothetical protein